MLKLFIYLLQQSGFAINTLLLTDPVKTLSVHLERQFGHLGYQITVKRVGDTLEAMFDNEFAIVFTVDSNNKIIDININDTSRSE